MGISGFRKITDCDVSVLILSLKKNLTMFTDDFDAQIHFSMNFPGEDIYYGVLLVCELMKKIGMDKTEIFNFVFDTLVPVRWKGISEKTLINLETAVMEFLGMD